MGRAANKRALRFAGAVAVLSTLATAASGRTTVSRVGQLGAYRDEVMVRATPASAWKPVTGRLEIAPGTGLKTSKGPAEVVLVDGTRVRIAPGSIVQFHPPSEINFEPSTTTRVSHLDLRQGEISLQIPPRGRPTLVMASPDAYGAFGPGQVTFASITAGMLVAVHHGQGKVSERGRWTELHQGQYQRLREYGLREGPRTLAPAPAFSSVPCKAQHGTVCAIALVSGASTASVGARWQPAAPNVRHHAVLARDRDLLDIVASEELPADRSTYTSPPLPPGSYWLAVTATRDGVAGGTSMRALRVVKLTAEPDVVFLADGRLVIVPEGKHVRIEDPSGLQFFMAPDTKLPVPGTLQIPEGDDRRLYHLHVADDPTDEVELRVERRTLVAEIRMQPPAPRWPDHPVWITIQLRDPLRRIAPETIHPRVKVEVNRLAVAVRFERINGALRAKVPPRAGPGPWSIRVEVADQHGNVMGRDVLHVIGRGGQGERATRMGW